MKTYGPKKVARSDAKSLQEGGTETYETYNQQHIVREVRQHMGCLEKFFFIEMPGKGKAYKKEKFPASQTARGGAPYRRGVACWSPEHTKGLMEVHAK